MRIVAAVLLFASVAAQAASPLPQVFSCGTQGTVGGLGTGVDLARYVVDVGRYPEAICNDGTPAIFYYGPATDPADRDKWIIFLQGGGSCVDGQTCAQRWCSGGWVEAGFGTASDYANRVEDEMRNMPVPEEPRAFTPGLFIPQCTDHESFTNDDAVFRVKIGGLSWHDAVWNWVTGASPQQLIRHYTGTPGKAPECP